MAHFTLKLELENDTRDILFDEGGLLETIEGDAATAQNVTNTLNAWKKEFILDETHGTDYDRILSQDYYDVSGGEAEEVYREAIFQETRVSVLKTLEVDVGSRASEASFTAELENGALLEKEWSEVIKVV